MSSPKHPFISAADSSEDDSDSSSYEESQVGSDEKSIASYQETTTSEVQRDESSNDTILSLGSQARANFDPKNERHLRMLLQATSTQHLIQNILSKKEYEHCSTEQKQRIARDALKEMVGFGAIDPEVLKFAGEGYEPYRDAVGQFMSTLVGNVSGSIVPNPTLNAGISTLQLESVSGFQLQTPRMGLEAPLVTDSAIYGPRWEEVECLGKGGFGSVWACKNLLDGEVYAIKKIIITDQFLRVAQMVNEETRERALAKLHHEVKVLAKLDHPNIVRYYSSWMERMSHEQFQASKKNICPDGLSQYYDEYEEETEEIEESEDGDVEDSNGQSQEDSSNSIPLEPSTGLSNNMDSLDLGRESKYNTSISGVNFFDNSSALSHESASSGGSDVQLVPRSGGPFMDLIPAPKEIPHVRILSIQMAKYALSLYDFIKTPGENPKSLEAFGFDYDFQPRIAVEIMSKIVEGVEYMHHYNLVHRDLKPANIFLKIEHGHIGDMQGSVRVSGCKCPTHSKTCPASGSCLPGSLCWATPKIGDFGLTADIKRVIDGVKNNEDIKKSFQGQGAVGTLLYTPPAWAEKSEEAPGQARRSGVHLTDAYALGIIFFELLQPFGTISQRHREISELRQASRTNDPFPSDFCLKHRSSVSEKIIETIKSIILRLTCEKQSRMDIPTLRVELTQLLGMF